MNLTPAIKGQLTKPVKASEAYPYTDKEWFATIRRIFERKMPRKQAKHAARKWLVWMAQ